MSFWQALLMGIVQGATEFLPVSSSGHLTLVPWLLGWGQPSLTFDTVLHVGTLLGVVVVLWTDIVRLVVAWFDSLRRRRCESAEARVAWLLILSSVPAAVLGFLLNDLVEQLFGSAPIVAGFLLVTGVLLFASDRMGRRERGLEQLNWKDALIVGLAQGIAIAPGLSRSGATIAAGLWRGLRREDAARYSFLMSLPVVLGAAGFQLLKVISAGTLTSQMTGDLAVGFVAAALSGYVAVRFLLGYVRAHTLRPFAYYCWIAGALCLAIALVR